jgi:hypothetical protein
MRHNSSRQRFLVSAFIIFSLLIFNGICPAFAKPTFYEKSFHFSATPMRTAYEAADGLMQLSEVPYDQLDCNNCHVRTCDRCHATEKNGKMSFSLEKARDMNTCISCHGKQGLTFMLGKQMKTLDVHIAKGMVCADCHKGPDMHGDGKVYRSMREPGAIKADCASCHTDRPVSQSHTVHNDKLDFTACHVSTSVSCMNCHFDTFVKTGEREGNFFLNNSYLLLMNHDNKVAAGTAMSFVTKQKKHIVYSPQFTHTVQKKGHDCAECHANEAVKLIEAGQTVPMMAFKEGKPDAWKGVVPTVHEKLGWVHKDKDGDKWIPLTSNEPALVQWWYSKPLSRQQIKNLAQPQVKN